MFLFSPCLVPAAPRLHWTPMCRAPAQGLPSEPSACAVGGRPGSRHSVLPSSKARSAQLLPDPPGRGHRRPASCASMEKSIPLTKTPQKLKTASATQEAPFLSWLCLSVDFLPLLTSQKETEGEDDPCHLEQSGSISQILWDSVELSRNRGDSMCPTYLITFLWGAKATWKPCSDGYRASGLLFS